MDLRKCLFEREMAIDEEQQADNCPQIIEGLATQVIAIVCWSFIIEFPDKASATGFLTENEAKYIQYRIEKDRGDSVHDALTWAKLFTLLRDVKLWIL